MPDTPIEQLVIEEIVEALEAMAAPDYSYEFATVATVKANVLDLREAAKPAVVVTAEEEIPFVYGGDRAASDALVPLGEIVVDRPMPVTLEWAFDATPTDDTDPSSVDRSKEGRFMQADLFKCIMALDHRDIGGSPIDIKMDASRLLLTEIESPLVYGGLRFTIVFRHTYQDATRL